MAELTNLKIWACYYYHQMGFNITHIIPSKNIERDKQKNIKKNPFKSSTNNRENFDFLRQNYSELESFDWGNAKGIGTVTGLNGLRALDFDGSANEEFIQQVLRLLGLPADYEWVVVSGGNNGFHIIFYCGHFEFAGYRRRLKRYYSNSKNKLFFKCIDLIWYNHLILPPSLHKSGNYYQFKTAEYPNNKPFFVEHYNLRNMLFEICYEYGGFNILKNSTTINNYYHIPVIDSAEIINRNEYEAYLKNKEDKETNNLSEVLFYSKTAAYLDKVYNKDYYELGLDTLKEMLKSNFSNKSVAEIACGNGYWTAFLSSICKSVYATDINESCISEAKKRLYSSNITFEVADCYQLKLTKRHDGLFGGFIISHVSRNNLNEFFRSINSYLKSGSIVLLFDNTLNSNNNMKIDSTNDYGDTLQKRFTDEGEQFLIIKNFFDFDELKPILSPIAYDIEFNKLKYFWTLKYKVK